MQVKVTITFQIEHESGKFIARDEIESQLESDLEDAMPSDLSIEDSTYNVESFEIVVLSETLSEPIRRSPKDGAK